MYENYTIINHITKNGFHTYVPVDDRVDVKIYVHLPHLASFDPQPVLIYIKF